MTTIDQLLAKRDARLGSRTGDKDRARSRAGQSKYIGNNFVAFDALRAHLFHPNHHPTISPSTHELNVAQYLERQGWIEQVTPRVWQISENNGVRTYLSGGWLEELVFLAHEEAGADEIYFGQDVQWSVHDVTGLNEIDVIARRGDQLSFTSCKTIRVNKTTGHMTQLREYVTETDYWNIHFADDKGRAILVTTADFFDEINKQCHRYPQLAARASILNVSISGLEELKWNNLLIAIDKHWTTNQMNLTKNSS